MWLIEMLAPEQILHAAMILSVESKDGKDEGLISQVQETLECDAEDHEAAMSHIENHRDGGNWGGRREAVLHRSRERVREAMENDTLPSTGQLSDALNTLVGEDDDGEIDPFAELGVASGGMGGSFGANNVSTSDPLSAFMDDDDEEEEDLVDGDGFLASESTLNLDGEVIEEEVTEPEIEEQPVAEEVEVEEPPEEEVPATTPNVAYEMLMSTCWIDGILDPAEAKLLARKRDELGISFEQHLEMLQSMLERSS